MASRCDMEGGGMFFYLNEVFMEQQGFITLEEKSFPQGWVAAAAGGRIKPCCCIAGSWAEIPGSSWSTSCLW